MYVEPMSVVTQITLIGPHTVTYHPHGDTQLSESECMRTRKTVKKVTKKCYYES